MQTESLDELLDVRRIESVICTTGALLDQEDFVGWLALFAENSDYEVSAYSSEFRKSMSWWKSDRSTLEKMLVELPRHVRDPARRLHLVAPTKVEVAKDNATALTSFAVYRTMPDGESRLYVVGRYEDTLVQASDRWLYAHHKVLLHTRLLDAPTHVPI